MPFYYDYVTLDWSENITCLNLNEFTITDFLEFVFPYYKKKQDSLKLHFFGDCEFVVIVQYDFIFVQLKSKDLSMVNVLQAYPGLCMVSNFTYCYKIYSKQIGKCLGIEDLQIISDLWRMHRGFKRIDMPEHNTCFQRLSPKRLTTLCQRILEDSGLDHLPVHVSKRLKRIYEDSDADNLSKRLAANQHGAMESKSDMVYYLPEV